MVVETEKQADRNGVSRLHRREARQPIRALSLTLLIMAYASMLPYNALWIEAMTSGALRTPILVYVEIALGIVGLFLLGGYSSATAGRHPWNSPRIFWATSTLFNGLIATMGFLSLENLDAAAALLTSAMSHTSEIANTPFLPGYVLSTVSSLSGLLIIFWMPVAALLSLLQLLQVFLRKPQPSGPEEKIGEM